VTPATEPLLTVQPRPAPYFLRRRFLRVFTPVGALAVAGLVTLLVSGNLLLPFERLVTLEGAMGSKSDFFDDKRVSDLLLQHHLQVHVTRIGSRDMTTVNLEPYDVVFPSGKPAVEQIVKQRRAAREHHNRYSPFVSPIVLATYREFAETLRQNGVATPQPKQNADPLYYDLDLTKFLDLFHQQKTWNQLGIHSFGIHNSNLALAQTSYVCGSNSGASYLGMVAFGGVTE